MTTNTHTDDTLDEQEECEYCGGEGTVVADAPVYAGEPHMAPIAEVPCICQSGDDIY